MIDIILLDQVQYGSAAQSGIPCITKEICAAISKRGEKMRGKSISESFNIHGKETV